MHHKRIKLSVVLLLGLGLAELQAQESVIATGGNASGSGGSASYSVGQINYATYYGTMGSIALGIQQPFEISTVTEIEEAKSIDLSVEAYPNPTNDFLLLKIEDFQFSNLSYQLYDMNGILIQNEKITGRESIIVMGNLSSATYFVKVTDENKELKIFKIIKN
jgi:hypothetical protein